MIRKLALVLTAFFALSTAAAGSPFGAGWVLTPDASSLTFTSTKGEGAVETSSFETLEGRISAKGDVTFSIDLNSVDTGIEIRDARMRVLLFETFRFPEAKVTARIEPELLAGLAQRRSSDVRLPISLTLFGIRQEILAPLSLTLITDTIVSVRTVEAIPINLADFNLLAGIEKLEQAAGVEILPKTEVEIDLLFQASAQADRALVPQISMNACKQRIQAIGASDQVYFTSGSAELETKSYPLLNAIADTIRSCPGMTVRIEGHTDNVGGEDYNLSLSDRRAQSVVTYLTVNGIADDRLKAEGFGEARPIADNATRRGRWKNRRIEFVAEAAQ